EAAGDARLRARDGERLVACRHALAPPAPGAEHQRRHQRGEAAPLPRVEDYLRSEAIAAGAARARAAVILALSGAAKACGERGHSLHEALDVFQHLGRSIGQIEV